MIFQVVLGSQWELNTLFDDTSALEVEISTLKV